MKEFEKQLKIKEFETWSCKNCINGNCPARSGHKISCIACEDLQENAWRAALEEVLEWLDYSAEHKEIADKIHEELES
jgi:hypothetical protein